MGTFNMSFRDQCVVQSLNVCREQEIHLTIPQFHINYEHCGKDICLLTGFHPLGLLMLYSLALPLNCQNTG
jgi:hypothetical protein